MIRADILNAMKQRFATISTAGGYNYTVAKAALFDVTPTPRNTNLFISIVDKGQTLINENLEVLTLTILKLKWILFAV
ncbi:MAG: hypothetical protein IPN18_16150 [Ignavibacteriales bacterium]|nr:hypothetical protein [Ignavibacteriales bacterium]